MNTSTFSQTEAHRLPFPFLDLLRRACGLPGRCYDRYLQRLDLQELVDEQLRDLGLSRREVRRECAKPFWQ